MNRLSWNSFPCLALQSQAAELLGLMHYMEGLRLLTAVELVAPTSDENVTVTDTELSGVPVRLYLPRRAPGGLRRAVLYFHGGGWCLGDAGELCTSLPWVCARELTALSGAAFCYVGLATGRGRGWGSHRLKAGGGLGKSARSAAKGNSQVCVCVCAHSHTRWALIAGMHAYDLMSRRISNELDAVVVSVK